MINVGEKVLLTQEQARAVDDLITSNFDWALNNQMNKKWSEDSMYFSLNKLSTVCFVDALRIGYEIEKSKFEMGDKVVRVDGNAFSGFKKIETVEATAGRDNYRLTNSLVYTWDFIRHATIEEIYWFETLERNYIGDFRIGDVVDGIPDRPYILKLEGDLIGASNWYEQGSIVGIYPAESFKSLPKE